MYFQVKLILVLKTSFIANFYAGNRTVCDQNFNKTTDRHYCVSPSAASSKLVSELLI
ncbi:hypothetical protein PIL02S_01766 [Paenibacillus illinoisensis]|uniref:Uncharacterized protein n=1 Tax=Paenibacillus illinoisensis TaxID=59845 RepID=A0A2W0CG98_9BACL|nr:hypothetical protein PIL02S_01766 [Paenibacillus illinoisensis]